MFFTKKIITSAYSKSSNFVGLNPILHKFCEICEIIFFKTVCGIVLIFCRSRFMNDFFVKNIFLEPWNHQKLKSWPIFFLKKFPRNFLKILSLQEVSWKVFFFNLLHLLGAFFMAANLLNFLHKKLILYFFQVWLFNFNAILKICFKMYYRKLTKNGDTLWKTSLEPNRLP